MTKDDVIKKIVLRLSNQVDPDLVSSTLYLELNGYDIVEQKKNEIVEYNQSEDYKAYKMFFISKKVEGLSDRSLKYYKSILDKFLGIIVKPLKDINSSDIRYYIAYRIQQSSISKCTQDNERRAISTFFAWLTQEEYISRNPCLSVKKIKQEKRLKKPFTEEELELIRKSCKDSRESALVEFLYSTGCRCGEVEGIKLKDVDFQIGKLTVYGKGEKEREVFLNTKCILALKEYINTRECVGTYLFETKLHNSKSKTRSASANWVEATIREIGKRAGVEKCHPHRFRRTTATTALNRGMPIDQVQKMLGHTDIKTTTIYAQTDLQSVHDSHKKYVV